MTDVLLDAADRDRRAAQARTLIPQLRERGVVAVAATWVDNSGITRVKAVPLARLEHAARWGIGASPVFDAFLTDDSIVSGRFAGGPVGDLRLHPDLDRLVVLDQQPGWAWAPADRFTQEGTEHPQDQRSVARRAVSALAERGCPRRPRSRSSGRWGRCRPGRASCPARGLRAGVRLHPHRREVGLPARSAGRVRAAGRRGRADPSRVRVRSVRAVRRRRGPGRRRRHPRPGPRDDPRLLGTARARGVLLAQDRGGRRRQRRARPPVAVARRREPVRGRAAAVRPDRGGGRVHGRDPAAPARLARDRRAVPGELSAADPAALGRARSRRGDWRTARRRCGSYAARPAARDGRPISRSRRSTWPRTRTSSSPR